MSYRLLPLQRCAVRQLLLIPLLMLLSACEADTTAPTEQKLRVETVARGLEHPWSLTFLPDASLLVTERAGRLRHISSKGAVSAPIAGLPAVYAHGQGGLFEVLADTDFAKSRRLYFSYAEAGTGMDKNKNGLAVARAELSPDNSTLNNVRVIFRQTPKVDSSAHFGGRLVLAPEGKLFITLGDRQSRRERDKAQDLSTHHGKVVRINRDGSIPADNPFVKNAGARPEIWSYGHRNIQGAAINPATGELWISEHGPQGGDEINIARAGKNYGWPVVTYGCEYGTCFSIGEGQQKAGMEEPLTYWVPRSIAPSGLAFYSGSAFPEWQGDVFSGALAGQALWQLTLAGNRVSGRQALLSDLGERIRDVRQGADGFLYLLTDHPQGRLLRVRPQ